jgi:hypothetical protein
MLRKIIGGFALAIAFALPAGVRAQAAGIQQRLSAEEMHAAGLDTLTPAQLAALDRLLREKCLPPTSAPRDDDDRVPRAYVGLGDKPVHTRAKGAISGWEPGTVFMLENGQQWKVLKGEMKLRKPLQDPDILVVPGIAGRWFLQVDEDLPKARVYRID